MGKRKGNLRQTEFQALDDATIERRAKDKRIPADIRERYRVEEKARGLRNRQKRS